jgi:hypothetical protein
MKIFTMAVLLGLLSSQAVTDAKLETPVESTTLQSEFVNNSNQLAMCWDNVTLATNSSSC